MEQIIWLLDKLRVTKSYRVKQDGHIQKKEYFDFTNPLTYPIWGVFMVCGFCVRMIKVNITEVAEFVNTVVLQIKYDWRLHKEHKYLKSKKETV